MPKIITRIALIAALIVPAIAPGQELSAVAQAQMRAIQSEKASRSPAQRKLETQLHYLTREAAGLPPVEGAPELTSRVNLEKDGRLLVDISAAPGIELKNAIIAAGGTVIYESPRWSSVRAIVPPGALPALAARADVKRIAKGTTPVAHAASYFHDAAEKALEARPEFRVTGAGIKVGVISDSDDHSEAPIASGELPLFTELPGRSGRPGSGEGTAMATIIHATAPDASIYFASASGGKPFFADSILMLQAAGCKIIVDDISYGNEWQFQDDEIGQAVNTVVAAGAVYLSASGNEGNLKHHNSTTWEGDFADGGDNALLPGGTVHKFGTQKFNRLVSGKSDATLQWSDEYHTSTNDYDLYVLNAAGTAIVASSTDTQDGTGAPMESVGRVRAGERIVIWKAAAADARYLRLSCTGAPLEVETAGQTIGHAATANCICVASSDASLAAPGPFTAASLCEDVSSDGPHKMFYQPNGTPVTPGNFLASGGVTIQTPAITAGDGDQTSIPGFQPFYGTSAAAPAAAAIAALVWQRNPSLSNAEVRTLLETSCIDIEDPGFDINSGNGILMADLALANALTGPEIVVEQPALTNLPTGASRCFGSVPVGSFADLTFTVRNVGADDLTGLGITILGANAGDFAIHASPSAPVAGLGGTTSFTARFTPSAVGERIATLHLASNDAVEGDFTVELSGLAPDPASIGLTDTVTSTTDTTRIYPLANDLSSGGNLSIVSVSDPAILIDGRALIIPEGFTGSFIYTVSDGVTTSQVVVNVTAGTPIVSPAAWDGLLYDASGAIQGAVRMNRNSRGILTGTLRVGTSRAAVGAFHLTSGYAKRKTALGQLTVIEKASGRLKVSLAGANPLEGSLRPDQSSAAPEQLHIALRSIDSAVPGGGYSSVKVRTRGDIDVTGKLPDGRAFQGSGRMADNDSFTLYFRVGGTHPGATVTGEFMKGNLVATDVTGELAWQLPPQRRGLQSGGVDTTLTANGCIFTPGVLPSDGPGTLTIAGGDLGADSTTGTTVTSGKPTLPALAHSWAVHAEKGTFNVAVHDPARNRGVNGSGIYLPKNRTAWGYFPGTTVGGSILLEW